jgi:hypothetical protein
MRPFGLSIALLLVSGAPILAQGDYGAVVTSPIPPVGHAPPRITTDGRDFVSPAQRMLLNYQQFGTRVGKFVSRWEQWARARDEIIESPVYDRESFLREEKLWRGVISRMNYLVDSRLSKGYLVAAEQLEKEKQTRRGDPVPVVAASPKAEIPVAPPTSHQPMTAISKTLTPGPHQTLSEYFAFQPEIVDFLSRWIEWQKVHIQLMRADTYDLLVFQQEAALWKRVTSKVDELKQTRAKRAFVAPKTKIR